MYKTQYAYSWIPAASGGGRELVRTEQAYSGGESALSAAVGLFGDETDLQ